MFQRFRGHNSVIHACWVSEAAVFLLSPVPVTVTAGSVVQEQSIDQKQARTIKGVTSSSMAGSPRARR